MGQRRRRLDFLGVPEGVLILSTVRESDGRAMAVSEAEIETSWRDLARQDGVLMCPEGAATHAAWQRMIAEGHLAPAADVLLFNCATGLK